MRLSPYVLLLAPAVAAAESPAMVTTTRGAVTLADGSAAPTPPFLLEEGQTLKVAEGGLVVVLFQGQATQLTGPATVSREALKTRSTATTSSVAVLDELLSRGASTAAAGASRSVGDLQLVRPVPGSTVVRPGEIRWRCEGCGEQQVQVLDLLEGGVVWSGTGTEVVAMGELAPGAYSVVVGGRDHAFTVAEPDERARAEEAAKAAEAAAAGLDTAGRASVVASIFLQAGLPTDALYTIDAALASHPDDAALKELRATFEARAGLAR